MKIIIHGFLKLRFDKDFSRNDFLKILKTSYLLKAIPCFLKLLLMSPELILKKFRLQIYP